LPKTRHEVKEQIEIAQEKQKEMYDKQIRHENHFNVGQKVLYYHAARDNQHTGKLLPKWKGPFVVHETGENGSYRLRSLDGKLFKTLVNGSLLKTYFELPA
ncbi:MAG: hypothetical protein JO131_10550, partial [Gammaproteobacteria bacterium]|nr:hypothetical protein [Gammaproteobacteria bacterium]